MPSPSPAPAPPATAANDGDAQGADRRQVTVLFADLTGFTSLAERLDPETVRAFQNALFETLGAGHRALRRLRREVRRRRGDGRVRRAARARGRPAARRRGRAARCCRASTRLSQQWAARLGRAGDPAHRRAHRRGGRRQPGRRRRRRLRRDRRHRQHRLAPAHAAEPGTVLVSDATQALVRASLRLRAGRRAGAARQGAADARSIGWSACAPTPALRARPGRPRPRRTAGRARRRHRRACWPPSTACSRARRSWSAWSGEAGSGKSRLLAEFFARLEAGRAAAPATGVRRATCSSLGEPTYGVFGALFREAYRVERGRFARRGAATSCARACSALGADAAEAAGGRAGAELPARHRGGRGRATSSPSSCSARSCWPRAR